MQQTSQKITPCLWFDTEGEEAATFYTSVFKNSRIISVARYGEAGPREAGTVMTVVFELDGQQFTALNGGPEFAFNEAISFQIDCQSQEEVDEYWERLGGSVRLGQGQVRRLLAGRPTGSRATARRRGHGPRAAGDGRDAEDGEDRHRRGTARVLGRVSEPGPRRAGTA